MARTVTPWRTDTYRRLNTPVVDVVGARTARALASLGVETVWDLVRHVPLRYLRGSDSSLLDGVTVGETAAILLRVKETKMVKGQNHQSRLHATLVDDRGAIMNATWFIRKGHVLHYLETQLGKGKYGLFVGKVGEFRGVPQMSHPKFVMFDARGQIVGRDDPETKLMVEQVSRSGLLGIYPQTSKINTWQISQAQQLVLGFLDGLEEPLPAWALEQANLPTLFDATRDVHLPDDVESAERGMRRLRFDEALALQVAMAIRRADAVHTSAYPCVRKSGGILDGLDARLPFELTDDQRVACDEIFADLARDHPMQRLLQGDVGSGKTIVALRAMLACVDAGHQAVLMAPTEVLARQHYETITRLLGEYGHGRTLGAPDAATDVVLLSSSLTTAQKRSALLKMASGEAGIAVGTHALLADRVDFAELGLIVVDEQHRFGVRQRAMLAETLGIRPHELVMTATPIPRSVAMTVFGDLVVSTLRGTPGGRRQVQTTLINNFEHPNWLDRAWQRIREEVDAGRQAFVVCPRIGPIDDDNPEVMLEPSATVEEMTGQLRGIELRGLRVEGLHGQMPSDQKESVMARFAAGEIDVLVTTTVVEVGIDVPNATVMVILDADRFGIAQLHQLRGRVGRGDHDGLCLLVTDIVVDPEKPYPEALTRLEAVASTSDGFALAELDLAQRREGNVLGESQSGRASTLRLLRVIENADEIELARQIAERWVAGDPGGEDPYLKDMVTTTDRLSAGDWLERH